MVKTLTALALMATLSACAMAPIPVGLPCSVGPIIPDKGASTRWTRSEKEQVITLNTTGARLCRWTPPN